MRRQRTPQSDLPSIVTVEAQRAKPWRTFLGINQALDFWDEKQLDFPHKGSIVVGVSGEDLMPRVTAPRRLSASRGFGPWQLELPLNRSSEETLMTTHRNKTPAAKSASQKPKNRKPTLSGSSLSPVQNKRGRGRLRSVKPVATGKIGLMVGLLKKPKGTSLAELCAATGWQSHSVRGALSGTIKKKLGLPLLSEKTDKGRIYRIAE